MDRRLKKIQSLYRTAASTVNFKHFPRAPSLVGSLIYISMMRPESQFSGPTNLKNLCVSLCQINCACLFFFFFRIHWSPPLQFNYLVRILAKGTAHGPKHNPNPGNDRPASSQTRASLAHVECINQYQTTPTHVSLFLSC